MSAPSFVSQPTTSTKSASSGSSLNDMLTVVAMICQEIMTAQWGRVRRSQNNGHHKNFTKTHEAKLSLDFLGGKYDCIGEDQQQL
jgi:hypothetical protein